MRCNGRQTACSGRKRLCLVVCFEVPPDVHLDRKDSRIAARRDSQTLSCVNRTLSQKHASGQALGYFHFPINTGADRRDADVVMACFRRKEVSQFIYSVGLDVRNYERLDWVAELEERLASAQC